MLERHATASWEGDLTRGKGVMRLGGGAFEGPFSFASRFEHGVGTNPEELIGAAHAGCFSMALSHALAEAGHPPTTINTQAKVKLEKGDQGFAISNISLVCVGVVPGIDEDTFVQHAREAKANCPVSKALAGPTIDLDARLATE